MLVLTHPEGKNLTKSFRILDGLLVKDDLRFGKYFDWEWLDVVDLNSLFRVLSELEHAQDKMVIRGEPRDREKKRTINRRISGIDADIRAALTQWLCLDIDGLAFPKGFEDFNLYHEYLAAYTVRQLPPEFFGVNFYYQFSGSMGIKPGIRIHLWYWLDRPISDDEARNWLAEYDVDLHLYNPVQPHYTAAPVFFDPAVDPMPVRSGLFNFENLQYELPVPTDLADRKLDLGKKRARSN